MAATSRPPGQLVSNNPVTALTHASVRATGTKLSAAMNLFRGVGWCRTDAERLMAAHARTFYFASRFLPPFERNATTTLYSFFRTLDDLVDEPGTSPASENGVGGEIEAWRDWIMTGMSDESPRPAIGRQLAPIAAHYRVPPSLFLDFLDGMESDLSPRVIETIDQLEHYSYQVASTVGLSMAHVFGATSTGALDAATRLGIAMQLTNILRDVGGDLDRGRIYLPRDEMRIVGLAPSDVTRMWSAGDGPDQRLKSLLARLVERADAHYSAGIEGITLLPPPIQMPILIAARLYRRILRGLEAQDYDSLRMRASTSRSQKLRVAVRCLAEAVLVAPAASDAAVVHGTDSRLERT